MKKNRIKLLVSLLSNAVAMIINMLIGFLLTPYIVGRIGSEAYGFASMANNFTSYIQILSVALNAMESRFITIAIHQDRYEDANKYFTSVFISNCMFTVVLLVPSTLFIINIESFVNVPQELFEDVKQLFIWIFGGFFMSLIGNVYCVSVFAKDRLDLQAGANIISYITKGITLLALYGLLQPKSHYIGIATFVTALIGVLINYAYTKKLLPQIRIKAKYYDFTKVVELIKSGIWSSILRLGAVLSNGCTVLLSNIFLGASVMGTVAVAQTLPGIVTTLVGVLGGVFTPKLTECYAKNNKKGFFAQINKSMAIMGLIDNVIISVIIVMGKEFYKLWVPGENTGLIAIIAILSLAEVSVYGGIQCMFNIFTVTNNIKANAIATVVSSVISIILSIILIKTTKLGAIAIILSNSAVSIARYLFFAIPYASKLIDKKSIYFYKQLIFNTMLLLLCIVTGYVIKGIFSVNSWFELIIVSFIVLFTVCAINLFGVVFLKKRGA